MLQWCILRAAYIMGIELRISRDVTCYMKSIASLKKLYVVMLVLLELSLSWLIRLNVWGTWIKLTSKPCF